MKITQQQMGLLKGLQEKDALILEIEKDRKNIPSMMKKAAAKLTLIQENEQLAKKQLEEAEMAHLQQEENLKNLEEQLKNGREKLEGIQNDREYKAANKEISQTINMIDESKTKIPQLLELVASAKEYHQGVETAVQAAQEERDQAPTDLETVEKTCDEKILAIRLARDEISSELEKPFLDLYEKTLSARKGVALVAAVSGFCKGCNMKIRGQLYNQVLRGETLEECPSCRRLLYAGQ